MHLYDETLDRYLSRELPPELLSTIDAHVSNCLMRPRPRRQARRG
jgi:hypothetical protein